MVEIVISVLILLIAYTCSIELMVLKDNEGKDVMRNFRYLGKTRNEVLDFLGVKLCILIVLSVSLVVIHYYSDIVNLISNL